MSFAKLVARSRRLPADALFSHETAAWLHRLDVDPCDPIHVTLPQRSTTSHLAGVSLTRSDYTDSEICRARGLPASSATRTVADLARSRPVAEAVAVLDMALRAQLTDIDQLREWTQTHPRHRGIRNIDRAMELADAASESPMETRLRILLVMNGLPRPRVQTTIKDERGAFVARADLCYPTERIAIEYDGTNHRERLAADNRRQNLLTDAGYRVLRFTAGDVLHRPASIVGLVRRALAA
jgi:very-short-patch-repair endonuclease